MKHRNSHNLSQGDIVKCTNRLYNGAGKVYFKENTHYQIVETNLNQTDKDEIFIKDNKKIKYIQDKNFSQFFVLDLKETRKQKLKKLNV